MQLRITIDGKVHTCSFSSLVRVAIGTIVDIDMQQLSKDCNKVEAHVDYLEADSSNMMKNSWKMRALWEALPVLFLSLNHR